MHKPLVIRKSKKTDREHKVLIGLVELFLETGKPIGSATLQEAGFMDLSSATIRNYFATLEEQGYLAQPHTSGGRIPTDLALKTYAEEVRGEEKVDKKVESLLQEALLKETKEPSIYLNEAAELLSQVTSLTVFFSAPRFDNDYIYDIKLLGLDAKRVMVVLLTSFGLIKTEILFTEKKLSLPSLKRIEGYFLSRLSGKPLEAPLEAEEERIAKTFYHEVMIRYIANHANFTRSDRVHTGFSHLLSFPEFNDPKMLAGALSLFENDDALSNLFQETKGLRWFIGEDLLAYAPMALGVSVITISYSVNQVPVGTIGVLGPVRIPYKKLFGTLKLFSHLMSDALTKSLYKFKLKYRQPATGASFLLQEDRLLLEDQRG